MPEAATAPAPPPKGHNGPSHDDIRMAAHQMVALHAEREAINTKISRFRKGLKAEGFTLGVLDAVIKMLEWSPEEVKAHYAERDWYAEALRFPIGTQLEFFGTDATPDLIRDQLKWRNIGFKDGLVGKGWPDEAPDGCGPDCTQSYGEGWEEGAATTRRAFAEKQKAVPPVVHEPEAEGADDDQPEEEFDADKAARDLKKSGFMDRVEAEAEADLETAA